MAMMNELQMPLFALRLQLVSALDLIVQMSRHPDGSRKVTHISEVVEFSQTEGAYLLEDLFLRTYQARPDGTVHDELLPTGHLPRAHARIREHGLELPEAVLEAARRRKEAGCA
jgi:pilus assembly protein CpaF